MKGHCEASIIELGSFGFRYSLHTLSCLTVFMSSVPSSIELRPIGFVHVPRVTTSSPVACR